MDGITLSITNYPDNFSKDDICFKDVTDGTANIHQFFNCSMIGKFVMFSKNRSDNQAGILVIELCYVEILGCRVGYFGPNCDHLCSKNCIGLCEPRNGECVSGCIAGWEGPTCDQACVSGNFGSKCAMTCSENCLHPPCNHVTGQCDDGCSTGWTSDNCTKECDSGSFGDGCSKTCDGCVLNECHPITGECTDTTRCKPGYYYSTTCNQTQAQEQPDSISGLVIGGIIGATIAVLIAGVAALALIRKRRKRCEENRTYVDIQMMDNELNLYESVAANKTKKSRVSNTVYETADDEDDYENGDENRGMENEYNNVKERKPLVTTDILIGELRQSIIDKIENNGFEKEFQILPRGLLHSHIEGCKSESIIRNRFKTIFPYDHSRVVLAGETKTDYINANYIENYSRQKRYIATQGPKQNTIRDFWHMVWQENAKVIVMVTNLVEGGVVMYSTELRKCDKYWPDDKNSPLVLDTYKIIIKEERKHTVYIYRCITIHNKTTDQQRDIYHFHFTEWPDHNVPDKIGLVTFYRQVTTKCSGKQGPMIVHCSAGIGLTGTFIAIDALYRHGKKSNKINVLEYAQMMRKDRMNMIQTKEQYRLVYEALLELFTIPCTSKTALEFCKYVKGEDISPSDQSPCRHQFQELLGLRQEHGDYYYSAAKMAENTLKNYDKDVLPHDSYRPYLSSKAKGRNDYINAVIVPEYSDKKGFLVTQCPLKNTTVDFWTMVYDHDCHLVILLDECHADAPLWKDNAVLNFTDFSITKDEETSETQFHVVLQHKRNETTRRITVLMFTDWLDDKKIPKSSHAFVDLIRSSKDIQTGVGKISVVCRDGCTRSGLFVCLSLILEKFKLDDEIDIFQVIRSIQIRRPEFVSTFEQFQFCHTCMRDHLEHSTDSLYANM